jgi:hypothetical protein
MCPNHHRAHDAGLFQFDGAAISGVIGLWRSGGPNMGDGIASHDTQVGALSGGSLVDCSVLVATGCRNQLYAMRVKSKMQSMAKR